MRRHTRINIPKTKKLPATKIRDQELKMNKDEGS
jgi:hypothetical protein